MGEAQEVGREAQEVGREARRRPSAGSPREKLEISRDTIIEANDTTVTIRITKHIFRDLCEETGRLKKAHETIGCPLSSALACILAKATGKPIIIQKEENTPEQTTTIEYRMLED